MAIPTRIYLTGFMGSGKSTVGPLLAEKLGYEFIDLDEAIASVAAKSVEAIFAVDGEEEFRRLEALKLRAVSRQARIVIALGGGAVTSEDNLYFVVTNGTLVYLKVECELLAKRLHASRADRPLLLDDGGRMLPLDALLERIRVMVTDRERFYQRASVVLEVGPRSVDETVDAVIEALARHVDRGGPG